MRSQFSFEFVIDVAVALVIVAFLVVFFSSISNTNSKAVTMSGVCSLIADTINSVSNSPAPSSVDYLPLVNITSFQNYTISVSDGVIIIYLLHDGSIPSNLISNTNVVSCGADTTLTASETFNFSNLAVYRNSSVMTLAYLYANYSTGFIPSFVYGGGFPSSVDFYISYPNGTTSLIKTEPSSFTYDIGLNTSFFTVGEYNLIAQSIQDPAVRVSLPFSIG
jgi:hypothetical protein